MRPQAGRRRVYGALLVLVIALMGSTGCGQSPSSESVSGGDSSALDAGPAPTVQGIETWKRRFDAVATDEDRTIYGPASRSADSWDHYNLAFGLDGYLAMYRATSDRRYLDVALRYAENLIATARPSKQLGPGAEGDDYRGWTSARADVAGTEVPLFESFVWRYVTETLRVVRFDPAVWSDAGTRARYARILEFAEHDIVEKWASRSLDAYVYRENTHMASHWASISVDLSRLTTSPERRTRYLAIARAIDRDLPNRSSSLRQQLVPNPADRSVWFWSDVWGSFDSPGQDVAHGNGVVAYMITANELGSEWTTADLSRLRALLRQRIWHRDGTFADFVAGNDSKGNGWISDGFMKLGRFDPRIQQRLENYSGAKPDNRGGEGQFFGNGALNARFLIAPGSVPGTPPGLTSG